MRSYFVIGAKLLGIYILYLSSLTIFSTIGALIVFLSSSSEPFSKILMVSSLGSLLILLITSLLLLFKTEEIATFLKLNEYEDERLVPNPKLSIQGGVILIGVYIFSTNIGKFLSTVFFLLKEANLGREAAGTFPHGLTFSKDLLTIGITIVLSIILIFGSNKIDTLISKKKKVKGLRLHI